VNADLNPELRKDILDWSFFDHTCKKCGETKKLLYPFLYHDMNNMFMVYMLLPVDDEDSEKSLKKLRDMQQAVDMTISEDFPPVDKKFGTYKYRAVTEPNELVEKLYIFENGFSDYAIELLKRLMYLAIGGKGGADSIEKILFQYDSGEPGLVAFMGNGEMGTIDFNQELYDDLEHMLKDYSIDEGNTYQVVDQGWAHAFDNSMRKQSGS